MTIVVIQAAASSTPVSTVLTLALKDCGIIGEGQTASADTINDAFATLNQMLGLWQADHLYVYAQQNISVTLTGATSYTVGIGGAINTARPVKIDAAFWRSGGVDYPVTVFNSLEDYERIGVKASGTMPAALYYLPSYPYGSLKVYPTGATGELHLIVRVNLPQYLTAADVVALPPEYLMALRYSLAEHLSMAFQTPLRPDIAAMASKARKIMKRNNVAIPLSQMPGGLLRGGSPIPRIY